MTSHLFQETTLRTKNRLFVLFFSLSLETMRKFSEQPINLHEDHVRSYGQGKVHDYFTCYKFNIIFI